MSRSRAKRRRTSDQRPPKHKREPNLATWRVDRCGRELVVVAPTELAAVAAAGGTEPRRHETWGDGVTRFTALARWSLRRENFYVRRLG